MGKLGFIIVFLVVSVIHIFALRSNIKSTAPSVIKPKTEVHKITLSSVIVKKPTPPQPIIKEITPAISREKPKPVVKKPKPKPKKVIKKQKTTKPKPKIEPKTKGVVEMVVKREIVQVVASKSTIDTTSIRDRYTNHIREEIKKNLVYPKAAKRLRLQDEVIVKFRVKKDGTISDILVINSPKKLLKDGAIKTLKSLNLKPIPSELVESYLHITIPIEFKIKG